MSDCPLWKQNKGNKMKIKTDFILFLNTLSTRFFELVKAVSGILTVVIIVTTLLGFITELKITADHYLALLIIQVSLLLFSKTYMYWYDAILKDKATT